MAGTACNGWRHRLRDSKRNNCRKSSDAWLILGHSLSSEVIAMSLKKFLAGIRTSLPLLLAFGQTSLVSLTAALADDDQVSVAGSPVFMINGPAASTPDRVMKIQNNIDNSLLATSDHGPSAVKVTYVKGVPVITLGGYYIASVDSATARAAGSTPALLAEKWAKALKTAMANKSSIDAYVAQLSGKEPAPDIIPGSSEVAGSNTSNYNSSSSTASNSSIASSDSSFIPSSDEMPNTAPACASAPAQNAMKAVWQPMPANASNQSPGQSASLPAYQPANQSACPQNVQQPFLGRIAYIPAGMTIPVRLATSLSSQVARAGDVIMAKTTESISLSNGVIPAGATLIGQVTAANGGAWMGHSGSLGIKFNTLRLPNGVDTPISAHITGNIGKYADKGNDTFHGENGMSKVKKALVATAIGAGGGAALGVAVGAIASGERGLGRGAWSGTAIGAGVGLAESLLVRKGSDVNLEQGQAVNLQLDAPVTTAMN